MKKEKKELTFKDIQMRNIVTLLSALVLLQVIFNWDKLLLFLDWIKSL